MHPFGRWSEALSKEAYFCNMNFLEQLSTWTKSHHLKQYNTSDSMPKGLNLKYHDLE